MDVVEREDFVSEMYVLAVEEGFLYEAPLGTTDLLPSGDVVHGPWDPTGCSKVLARWHLDGLIGLWVLSPVETDYEIGAADATQLLDAPARWQPGSDDGLVSVVLTDSGTQIPYERWRQVALSSLAEG